MVSRRAVDGALSAAASELQCALHRFKPYPAYKDSGVEWLGQVPAGWVTIPLKQIASIRYGLGEPPEQLTNGLPFIRATNVSRGRIIADGMQFVDPNDVPWDRDPVLRSGDIIVVRSGAYTGDSAIIPSESDGAIAGYDMVVRLRGVSTPNFIAWAFLSRYVLDAQIKLVSLRAAQPHLNAGELGAIVLLLPPGNEQRGIAAFLDRETARIDALVAKKEQLIALLQEKRTVIISRAVTRGLEPDVPRRDSGVEWLGEIPAHWTTMRLKNLAALRAGTAITADRIEPEGDYPVFGGNGLRGYTSSHTHDGEFPLVGRQGALCGCVSFASGKFWASEHAIVLAPRADVDPHWLAKLLQAMSLNAYSQSAAQPGLAVETIATIPVPAPPIEEQRAIIAFLDQETVKIDTLVAKVRGVIDRIKELRAALISAAVTGKIDIRGEAA